MQVTLLVVVLAIMGYGVAANNIALTVLASAGAISAWWARTRPWAVHVPRFVLNLALMVSVLFVASLAVRSGVEIGRVAELMIVLTIIKCFDRQHARDYMEIYTLALFLVIAAVMTSVSLELGLVLLAFLPTAVVGVMLLQVFSAHERVAVSTRHNAPPSAQRTVPRLARGTRSSSHFRRTATAMLIMGATVAITVFVLVPRGMGENILGTDIGSSRRTKTAFTGKVQLGQEGLLSESTVPVLHLAVTNEFDQNVGGESIVYYLRGNVLDRYDASEDTWTRSDDDSSYRGSRRPANANEWIDLDQHNGSTLRQSITMLAASKESDYLFAVYKPIRIRFDRNVQMEKQRDSRILVLNNTRELKYEVESAIQPAARRNYTPETDVSFDSAVVRSFAERVLQAAAVETDPNLRTRQGDRSAIIAIRDFFHRDFAYTTDIQAPPSDSQDPIEWFLSDRREGHCEYFASAMTAMCRSIGIDARVVTGYVAVEWNEMSSHYVVRESNAHAWVEVRNREGTFRTYDPTPPDDLRAVHTPEQGFFSRLRSFLDTIEHLWVSRVVTFDSGMRDTLIRDGGGIETSLADSAKQLLGKTKLGGASLALQASLVGLLVCTIVVAIGAALRLILARTARTGSKLRHEVTKESHADEPWMSGIDFYYGLLEELQSVGHPKPLSCPPLKHLDSLQSANPVLARAAQPLVALYYRARFGHRSVSADEQNAAAETLLQIKDSTAIIAAETSSK